MKLGLRPLPNFVTSRDKVQIPPKTVVKWPLLIYIYIYIYIVKKAFAKLAKDLKIGNLGSHLFI
jgi:hypothetical protein